jgi:hypothetical protein
MQRWITAGVLAMVLLVGGGAGALYVYKQSRPYPVWVPMPINPELSVGKRDEIVKELRARLSEQAALIKVSQAVGLAGKWQLASDEEAARRLGERLFVKLGDADSAIGKVPAIHVGVTGTKKERKISEEVAMQLMDDVCKILGIKPPVKKAP